MNKNELIRIKEVTNNYCHSGSNLKFLKESNYPVNNKTINSFYSNYRVVGESKYYCLSKDNTIFTKYKAYKTRFSYRSKGREFRFYDDDDNDVYIKPNELNKYFYSDIDLYKEGILEIFNCKSDEERISFIRRKKI